MHASQARGHALLTQALNDGGAYAPEVAAHLAGSGDRTGGGRRLCHRGRMLARPGREQVVGLLGKRMLIAVAGP